jgi:hypothetical protein
MPQTTETLAGRYAGSVHRALLDDFPRLKDRTLELIVLENVARQAEMPSRAFELVVDDPSSANWRLVPDHVGPDRWRVQLACCKPRPSHANGERERRINMALRAIQVDPDAEEARHG